MVKTLTIVSFVTLQAKKLLHLAPGRADYVKAFEGLNVNTEKISGTLFEISGTLAKTLATLKSSGTPLGVSLKAQELFLKSVDPIL